VILGVIIKLLFIVLVVAGLFLPLITWVERKQSAVMQDRIGANRADVFGLRMIGLLHPAADVLKLLTKEDVVPAGASRIMHQMAPVMALVPAIVTLAVIPFGGTYTLADTEFSLVVADIDWGMLFILAVGSLATYGAVMAGWASNSNWGLLGSMRASAQMISYEVTMGLSIVGIFMCFNTLKLTEMAAYQDQTFQVFGFLVHVFGLEAVPAFLSWVQLPMWGIFLQPLGFILFLTCIMAENKRPPFNAPEGESEIIAGYHMEYSGMRFGLFYTAEFLEVPVIGTIDALRPVLHGRVPRGAGDRHHRGDAVPGRLGHPLALDRDDHRWRRLGLRSRLRHRRLHHPPRALVPAQGRAADLAADGAALDTARLPLRPDHGSVLEDDPAPVDREHLRDRRGDPLPGRAPMIQSIIGTLSSCRPVAPGGVSS
jgi:NADH-quinone oxidoreductase subunit H